MKHVLRLLLLFIFFSFPFCARQGEPSHSAAIAPASAAVENKDIVPQKVREVLRQIRETGHPPEGYVGGRVWQNRERNLPLGGHYREYDVNPKVKGRNRGPERLVIEETAGTAWYTPDHYRTFIPIK